LLRLSSESLISLEKTCVTYQQEMNLETVDYLRGRGLTPEVIDLYRLGTVARGGEHQDYAGLLSIPYVTKLAGVVGFKFRQLHDCTKEHGHQKYYTPYPTRIFNATAFEQGERLGYIGVAEGEFDAIVATAMCGIPTVGVPGVETWSKHKAWPLMFQGFERVLVFKDYEADKVLPDGRKRNPGNELAEAILRDVHSAELVGLAHLGLKDVSEMFAAHGADPIREAARV
jgi:hypothetical protein